MPTPWTRGIENASARELPSLSRCNLLETRGEAAVVSNVAGRSRAQALHLLGSHGADGLRGRPDDEGSVRIALVLEDQRVRADEAPGTDARAVQDRRAHADERSRPDDAAVQDGLVADGAVLADHHGEARIRVQDRAVLDVRARADVDKLVVAAQDGAEPDAGVLTEADPPHDLRARGDPPAARGGQFGTCVVEGVEG